MGKLKEIRDSERGQEMVEKGQQMVEKGRKGILQVVFGRTTVILLLLLLQVGILVMVTGLLQEYIVYAYWAFILLTNITVIVIINREGNPGFKLAWMVPITLVPVFGILLYLFVELQPGTRLMNRRLLGRVRQMRQYAVQNPEITEKLKEQNPQMANLARYIHSRGGCPAYQNTAATYYPSGEDKFAALVEELKKARKFIFMEYFIVAKGHMWGTVLEILKQKVREGVEVRFMYDGTNTLSLLPYDYPRQLEAYGIQCKVFNPIRPALSTSQNNRDHRKIVVIDGLVAFTGGVNLADEYINEKDRFGHWKDTAIMVRGDAVRSFTLMFLQMWDIDTRADVYDQYLNIRQPVIGDASGYVIPYGDSPLDKETVGELVYMDILNTARDYVHIMTPYLILDNEMVTALTFAAKRGVDVKIIMPDIPDKKYAFALAKTYYPELLRAGVRIFQYVPGFVHAKVFTSDDVKAVVGTINLDYRSLYLHFECAVLLYQSQEILRVEQDFQETLKQCREITMDDYRLEKLGTRFYGHVLRLFAPLM
mgnify:CR=1 FL=1